MNIVTKEIVLNVSQPNNYELVHAMQGDNDSIEIKAVFYNLNKLYTIDADMILLSGCTASGAKIENIIETYDEHSVTFPLTKNMLSVNGDLKLSVVFVSDGKVLSSFPFVIKVINAPIGTFQADEMKAITDFVLEAADYAKAAESFTHGGTGTREGEETDNAENYYKKSKEIYDNFASAGDVSGVKGNEEKEYRHGNVNLTPANIGALALTGGTVTGETVFSKGTRITELMKGTDGIRGFVKIATLTINLEYSNRPITIEFGGRGRERNCALSIQFANSNNLDPSLSSFTYIGTDYECYMHKREKSTWDLYAYKSEGFDGFTVFDYKNPIGNYITVTWDGKTQVSAVPEGAQKAVPGGNIGNAYTLDGCSVAADSQGGSIWGRIPRIRSVDGVMEVGKYIDFHITKEGTSDYDARLSADEKGLHLEGITRGSFEGNLDGKASSADNADTVDGYHVNTAKDIGNPWGKIPVVQYNGCMEVGKFIDFHATNDSASDRTVRVTAEEGGLSIEGITHGNYEGKLKAGSSGGILESANNSASINFVAPTGSTVFFPSSDGGVSLGWPSVKWGAIYSTSSTISTSDRNKKHDISYVGELSGFPDTEITDNQLIDLIMGIKPTVYKYDDGTSNRPHHGIIAQDFEELLKKLEIDHAGFIKSEKMAPIVDECGNPVVDENNMPQYQKVPNQYDYAFRYEELISDIIRFCQILYEKIIKIETK